MTSPAAHASAVTVTERVRARDLVLFAITALVVAALPWMLVSAGSEPVSYQDSQGQDTDMPAWLGVLILLAPLLGWSGIKVYHLLKNQAAAVIGPSGIRLYIEGFGGMYLRQENPIVDVPWDEVARVVVWRLRQKSLGFIPVWESWIGVEKTTDWHEVSQKEPTEKQRQSAEARPNGSPVRLSSMLYSRSVRLGPHGAKAIATATARFAPRVEVVDERVFGKSPVIEPDAKRDKKTY
jgi:hypothetical protein